MLVDTFADVGLRVMVAVALLLVATVNVVEAESSSGLPVAVIVYEFAAMFATVKDPVNDPSEMEQVCEATALPVNEHE